MKYLIDNHIRLNIVPTSNVKLGRVSNLSRHPIKTLYHAGIDVTINSDDVLIFDSDVSKEYLRLYEAGTLTAKELDDIRINGLRKVWVFPFKDSIKKKSHVVFIGLRRIFNI